jgi:hypothetical protein
MEFPYLSDLLNDKAFRERMHEKMINGKICYGDPGSRSPITLNGTNGIFNYRNRRRRIDTKRSKYSRLIKNKINKLFKSKNNGKIYDRLKECSTKTTYIKTFKKYIKIKYEFLRRTTCEQMNEYRQYQIKLRWYSYINTQRHEDNLLNEIEAKYGKDTIFILGDWSRRDKIKGLSAPNMRIKRLLDKRFEVYLIDEYLTSKLNHSTLEEMKHPEVKIKIKDSVNTITKELFSVFMFTTKDKTKGYINRDYNATLNMKTITESEILGHGRPECFTRKYQTGDFSKEKSKSQRKTFKKVIRSPNTDKHSC